jgi:antitoxin HicB
VERKTPSSLEKRSAMSLEETALKETGIAKTQLGEMLGKDEKEIRRILDPHHGTKLPTIEQALNALGKWPELYLH